MLPEFENNATKSIGVYCKKVTFATFLENSVIVIGKLSLFLILLIFLEFRNPTDWI